MIQREASIVEVESPPYWESSISTPSPLESLAQREIPVEDVKDFVLGCQKIFKLVQEIQPSVIFYPERGGGILSWVMNAMAGMDGIQLPPQEYLLSGNYTNALTGKLLSPTDNMKRHIVARGVREFLQKRDVSKGNIRNPVVIDEKTGGRSSKFVASQVKIALEKNNPQGFLGKIHLVVLEYSPPKIDHFAGLSDSTAKTNFFFFFEPHIVAAPNPFVDQKQFLDTIFASDDLETRTGDQNIPNAKKKEFQEKVVSQELMHMHNTESEQLIKAITSFVLKPETLDAFIWQIEEPVNSEDQADHLPLLKQFLVLRNENAGMFNALLKWFYQLRKIL